MHSEDVVEMFPCGTENYNNSIHDTYSSKLPLAFKCVFIQSWFQSISRTNDM